MNEWLSVAARGDFLPHGYCFTWSPALLWSMVGADAVIAASYFTIPMAIVTFSRKRPAFNQWGVAWLFCAFIFACGITHVMDIWTIWRADYWAQSVTKLFTAVASLATAVALWPLLPRALAAPSVSQLQAAISALEVEVQRRRSAEEHLLDVEQALSSTLGGIGAGFITTDVRGRVTRMNQVASRVTGWRPAEATGHSLWDVFQREGRPKEMAQSNPVDVLVGAGISPDAVQTVVSIARDGTRTELELRAAVTRGDDGLPRGMALVFRDVTRLNRAEAESRRLAAIVTSSNDAIIGKTVGGIITDWNAAAERMFGYTADEAISKPISILIPPEREEEGPDILRTIAQGGAIASLETVRRTKDGRRIDISVSISPIRDGMGRVVGASKIARDITESIRRNEELKRSNAELEQFAYVASHDLQEPLRMVVNYTELFAQRYRGTIDETADKYIHYASDGARRMQRLVRDLLAFSRVGSTAKPLAAVSSQAVVDAVVHSLDAMIKESGATVTYESLPTVLGDEGQLHQLFQNLIINAIKFRGVAPPRISISAIPTYERWEFAVHDNGIGIDEQFHDRVFQMFQRLHARHEFEGSGIGLAIAKRILERHGGSIWVDSSPGEGSVFRFTLRTADPRGGWEPSLRT